MRCSGWHFLSNALDMGEVWQDKTPSLRYAFVVRGNIAACSETGWIGIPIIVLD